MDNQVILTMMRRVVLVLAAASATAQECTLAGVVIDKATGQPLEAANVSVSATSGNPADVFTDRSGRFCFAGLAAMSAPTQGGLPAPVPVRIGVMARGMA